MSPAECAGVAIRCFRAEVALQSLPREGPEQRWTAEALTASHDDVLPLLAHLEEMRLDLHQVLGSNVQLAGELARALGRPLPPELAVAQQLLHRLRERWEVGDA